MIAFLLAALLALPAQAQEAGAFNSGCFHGGNDAQSPAALPDCESPDLLNVESNLNGTAILKRKGFSKFADLTVSTAPVNGSHSFIDSNGNRLDIVCQDRNCAKSTNGNAFATFLTTAASGITRWSFVDQGGVLYGANNKYDPIMKYDGTTRSSPSGMPLGSILALTQDRLAVGDISGIPNRVHRSSAGAYEQFTLGVNPEDSFYDDVGAEGDKIRGIKCIGGNCFIFKTASITLCEEADQYNTQCSVLSPTVGTTDPASIIAAGSTLYFRAQDKSYWEISQGGLRQISKKIPNLVKSQSGGLGGGENTNTQTTQGDWQAGTQIPLASWNTTTTNGSIFPSSFSIVETSSAQFGAGVLNNISTSIPGAIFVTQPSSASFINAGNESNSTTINWSSNTFVGFSVGDLYGSREWRTSADVITDRTMYFEAVDESSNVIVSTSCSPISTMPLTDLSIDLSTQPYARIRIHVLNAFLQSGNTDEAYSVSFIRPQSIKFRAKGIAGGAFSWDIWEPSTYITSASYTSAEYNTGFSTPTYGTFTANMSSNSVSTIKFLTTVSATSAGSYDAAAAVNTTNGRITSSQKQYIKAISSFTVTSSTDPALVVYDETLLAATTGQFTTQCIQPNSTISAWGTLSCAQTLAGNGSHVFYTTSAATCNDLPTSDPSTWQTSIANNATVTISTNIAVKIGFRSLLGSATDQAQVDACVLAWNEGATVQPVWAAFDSVKNAVYWTSTINSASSTNRLLKYDRNLEQWYPFDIPAQAPRFINNSLYFGGASSGTWNAYGLVDSDAGSGINAYWKSKDVGSDRPFQEKSFQRLSILSRNNGTGSMTGTYTFSNAATGSYTISLSTGTGINYARSNFNLPLTSPHEFINIKVGNSNSTPFEVLGLGVTWQVQPWKVNGP